MNKPKPIGWFTRGGKHIPIFDEDEKAKWDQIQKNKQVADKLNAPAKVLSSKQKFDPFSNTFNASKLNKTYNKRTEPMLPDAGDPDPAVRMVNLLAKKGISSEADIANYLRNLSPQRRNRLAVEMGIKGRGDDKTKEMANRIFLAGKRDEPAFTPTVTFGGKHIINKYGFEITNPSYKQPEITFTEKHWEEMKALQEIKSKARDNGHWGTVDPFTDRYLADDVDEAVQNLDYKSHEDIANTWNIINGGSITEDEYWAGYHLLAKELNIKAPRYGVNKGDTPEVYDDDGLFSSKEAAFESARLKGYKRIYDRYTGEYENVPAEIKPVQKKQTNIKFEKVSSEPSATGEGLLETYEDKATGFTIKRSDTDNFGYHTTTIEVMDKNGKRIQVWNSPSYRGGDAEALRKDRQIFVNNKVASLEASMKQYTSGYSDILGDRREVKDVNVLAKYLKDNNIINPNYKSSGQTGDEYYKWHKNCAICSAAAVLQMKGYDVEAGPRRATWRGCETIFDYDLDNPDNFIIGSARGETTSNFTITETINDKIKERAYKKYPMDYSQPLERRRELKRLQEDYIEAEKKKYKLMPQGASQAAEAIKTKMKEWGSNAVAELSVDWKNSTKAHSVLVLFDPVKGVYIWDAQTGKVRYDLDDYLRKTVASHTQLVRVDNAKLKPFIEDDLKYMFKRRGGI